MTATATATRDDKVNQVFAGKCVRKDLVRAVKVGANVPVFVLEYLLGKYCASSDPAAMELGLATEPEMLELRNARRTSWCRSLMASTKAGLG